MYQLKWLLKRFGFLKRIILELIYKSIYQKDSQFLLHSWNAHRAPFESILFYNFFGRVLWAAREMIFKNSLKLEGFETTSKDLEIQYQNGSDKILWPKSPMIEFEDRKICDEYYKKIEDSLTDAYEIEKQSFDKTKEWNRIAVLIQKYFFDQDGHVIKQRLVNFRSDTKLYQELFNDQFNYLDLGEGYIKSYLKSIDLILEYHRLAQKVDTTLLAALSESDAGNNICVQYRGKRVSEKSLFHAVVANDLIKAVPFCQMQRSVLLDIGCGYGALSRILHYYTPNSCHILLDLPETLVMTSYFIKYNFSDAKIALLSDIIDNLDHFDKVVQEYDFIIIVPSVLRSVKSKSVDLVINTASMGFMQKEYLDFYLDEINRVLKEGGYFYSLNKEYNDQWGIGFYNWDFKASYNTRLFEYNNRFSYAQWLGQKVK